jgi:hypothetical protein
MRVLNMEKPTCPFVLSTAQRVWAQGESSLALFQTLAAPKPRMYWFVCVASTVQVPAITGRTGQNIATARNDETFSFRGKSMHLPQKHFLTGPFGGNQKVKQK